MKNSQLFNRIKELKLSYFGHITRHDSFQKTDEVEGKRGRETREKAKEKLGAGHQPLAGRRHCERRKKNGRKSSTSWTHPGIYVSQR